jgi:hypothetical protein
MKDSDNLEKPLITSSGATSRGRLSECVARKWRTVEVGGSPLDGEAQQISSQNSHRELETSDYQGQAAL